MEKFKLKKLKDVEVKVS